MGKGLSQQLADRKPEAQPERVQYHEEHPKPVDQEALGCHGAPLSRADCACPVQSARSIGHERADREVHRSRIRPQRASSGRDDSSVRSEQLLARPSRRGRSRRADLSKAHECDRSRHPHACPTRDEGRVLASVETLERGVAGRDHPETSYPLARHTHGGRVRPHLRVRPRELVGDRPVVRLDVRKTFDVAHGLVLTAGIADLGFRRRHRPRRRYHALSAARARLAHITTKGYAPGSTEPRDGACLFPPLA